MQTEHGAHAASPLHTESIAYRADSGATGATPISRVHNGSLDQISDEQLLSQTRQLVGHSNRVLAALLAHLAEVEARGVHRIRACSSLYTYCIYELRFSEDESARRVSAARLVKRFPALLVAVERGELHLTGLLLLGPHLTAENHHEVLARARHRTKKEIQKLIRELCPLPDVPACIEPLGPAESAALGVNPTWEAWVQSLCPVRELRPGDRPADWLEERSKGEVGNRDGSTAAPARVDPTLLDTAAPARVDPALLDADAKARVPRSERREAPLVTGPQRYRVQFSAGEEYVELVERARALLSHSVPNAALEDLHVRAMQALVLALEKRRYAVTEQPRRAAEHDADRNFAGHDADRAEYDAACEPVGRAPERGAETRPSRAVPARVRRAVFERDGSRCTYVDDGGQRCRETHWLELHHVEPFGRGGAHHATNVCLRCRAHNGLAAELDFGCSLIRHRRDGARYESAHTFRDTILTRGPH